MKPAPFEYLVPNSFEEALSAMAEHGSDAKILAGGQSLVPAMNFRVAQPQILVDLNQLVELDYIRQENGGALRVGSMTRQRKLETDPLIASLAPLVSEAMPYVAHPQIRNRGTFGGSLAHADPAAELPVIALALGARILARSTRGERWIPAEDFFLGMFATDLAPDEILTEVELPAMPKGAGFSFLEVARRQGDYAMLGLAAVISLDEQGACGFARLVFLNAGDGPVEAREATRHLLGNSISDEGIEAAAVLVDREIDPWGNVHASPDYQRHLARVLTRRALEKARERAARQWSAPDEDST
jgi:aerobic carbon-monoxide dehydrogenase medium subunit